MASAVGALYLKPHERRHDPRRLVSSVNGVPVSDVGVVVGVRDEWFRCGRCRFVCHMSYADAESDGHVNREVGPGGSYLHNPRLWLEPVAIALDCANCVEAVMDRWTRRWRARR